MIWLELVGKATFFAASVIWKWLVKMVSFLFSNK